MAEAQLYLVQYSFSSTPEFLEQFQALYAPQDSIVLLGDAVLHQTHAICAGLDKIYMLEHDAQMLNGHLAANIQVLDYVAFADLCLAQQRCISLK